MRKIFLGGLVSLCWVAGFGQVIFEENFEGSELNMEHWSYEEGDGCPNLCGWGNNEQQVYDRKQVTIEDGKLVITAEKSSNGYVSGKINTKDKVEFQYGIIEVRAKLPRGKGMWPAIWMLGADIENVSWPASGEIDVMEYVGRDPGVVHSSLHTPASHGNTVNTRKTSWDGIEDDFHTYKAVWTKESISFFIDDQLVYEFVPEVYDQAHYPFQKPFYLLINLAVGGNFGGQEIDDGALPAKFYIDWVRIKELP